MTVDCIVFKVDGTPIKYSAEPGSSHIALIDSETSNEESYATDVYTNTDVSSHPVYKIAYQARPSDDEIKDAISKLEPFPIQLMK